MVTERDKDFEHNNGTTTEASTTHTNSFQNFQEVQRQNEINSDANYNANPNKTASSEKSQQGNHGRSEEPEDLGIVFIKAPPSVLEQQQALINSEELFDEDQDQQNGNNGNFAPDNNGGIHGGIEDEIIGLNFDEMCEVVLSFKCRYCTFLCQDRRSLTFHIKSIHQQSSSSLNSSLRNNNQDIKTAATTSTSTNKPLKQQIDEDEEASHGYTNNTITRDLQTRERETSLIPFKKQQPEPEELLNIKIEPEDEILEPFAAIEPSLSSPAISAVPHLAMAVQTKDDKFSKRILPAIDQALQQQEEEISLTENLNHNGTISDTMMEIEDQMDDVFLCAECDIVFSSKELCCKHMHTVHDLKQFNADFIQDEIISKKPSVVAAEPPLPKKRRTRPPKHLTAEGGTIVPKRYRVTKEIFFTCGKCPIKFESVEVMKFHEQCHAPSNNLDDSLENETLEESSHNKSKKGGGFVCPVCEAKSNVVGDEDESLEIFSRWGLCSGHLWREHKIDCELYSCSICKQFKSHLIARVKEHEELHSKQAVYVCKTCHKPFKQLKQLRCHEKYHVEKNTRLPPPKESRWYTPKECHICKRVLSDAKCLKKHIAAVHNKLKPFCCNVCGHMTARKAELQLHIRQHTGEKPYKCTVCPFATGDHNSLRKHKLRHSDQRPYACPYCDYRCIQSCAFKKHILAVHPGQEVVFQCQLCSHASVNEAVFTAHQKQHRNGRSGSESRLDSSFSPSNGQNNGPGNSPKSKKSDFYVTKPRWLEDDSMGVDVVDIGGHTIPASPVSPTTTSSSSSSHPPIIEPQVQAEQAPSSIVELQATLEKQNLQNENEISRGEREEDTSENSIESIPALLKEQDDIIELNNELPQEDLQSSNPNEEGSTILGTFNVPLGTSGPIIQLGQTTYILLPPNTPFPFMASAVNSSGQSSTSGGMNQPSGEHSQNVEVRDNLLTSRTISSLTTPSTTQLLENIQQLDALDLAEVMTLTTNSSVGLGLRGEQSGEDNMFERILGMSGI